VTVSVDYIGGARALKISTPVGTITKDITGQAGRTVTAKFAVSTASLGTYVFEVWIVDDIGNSSNKLSGPFTVTLIGIPDSTFGTGGMVLFENPIFASDAYGRDIATQSDGKILVTGYLFNGTRDAVLVLRYNNDGILDDTFGTDGFITYNECGGCAGEAYAVAVQSDGKILVAGYTNSHYTAGNQNILLLRYNIDGTPDNTFGTNGVVITDVSKYGDYGYAVAIQTDGKIVVAGRTSTGTDGYALILRYNSDGTLDDTFGTNGVVTYDGIGWDEALGVAIQTDGKIVITGGTLSGSYPDVLVLRYTSDGILDNTFGTNGAVTYDSDYGNSAIAIQLDGKIVVGGGYRRDGTAPGLLRYNSDGTLDSTFGVDGAATIPEERSTGSIVLQPDGKIVVVSPGDGFMVLRYNSDGTFDTSFSGDGIGLYTTRGRGYGVALQADGNIVVTGNSGDAVLTIRVIGQ
jgi:uncharacterized delta-60 repeat protein